MFKPEKHMKQKISLAQGCVIFLLIYFVCIVATYFIAGDQFQYHASPGNISVTDGTGNIGEIVAGGSVKQIFVSEIPRIDQFSLFFATYGRTNRGNLLVSLSDIKSGTVYYRQMVDVSRIPDNSFFSFTPPAAITGTQGRLLQISVSTATMDQANAVTLCYNAKSSLEQGSLIVNNRSLVGSLMVMVNGKDPLFFGQHYFAIMGAVGLMLALYCFSMCRKKKTGGKSYGLNAINAFTQYRFLLEQLVSRDFKTKYKRSVLGVLWSFLNPLLSMTVQYVVFSTIFKSNIQNFAVYLLIGIVFFNFFMEATSMGLSSIVGNAPLIAKVYIPKYIFPVSRVISSVINFLLSLIPLLLSILVTRTAITPAILLFLFPAICTFAFCVGMSMLLSSMMVFFRDTQFLWNVVSMLWVYATPIFYPETILPAKWMFVFKMNPLYHFIRFARTIILQGVSPEPQAYLFCLIAAIVPLILGVFVFKKTQNKFVLYI